MSFFSELGKRFQELAQGITGNIAGSAALKGATAAQIQANAAITGQQLAFQEEQNKRQERLILVALIIVFLVPLAGLYILKKT